MARTRGDDFEIRRRQILDGALAVFAEKGFSRATNADIARAAGIGSAGLIYHYFQDKRDLLDRVMQERVPILQLLAKPDELRALPPEEMLPRFARGMLDTLDEPQAVAFMRVMLGEAARDPSFAAIYGRLGPMKAIEFLTDYFQAQMEAGTLRRGDPAAAARCFLGPLIVYVLTREVLGLPDSIRLSAEIMATTCVTTFLDGMRPD